jgi:hypothetical protein
MCAILHQEHYLTVFAMVGSRGVFSIATIFQKYSNYIHSRMY